MGRVEPVRRVHGPVTALGLLRLAIAGVFVARLAPTWADSDLWGHLRFGNDIVAAGLVPLRDPYAFTSAERWINQSWLGDILLSVAWAHGGAAGLVAIKLALASAVFCVTLWTLRRAQVPGPLLELLLFLALAAAYPSIPTVRPHLFSLLCFAGLLHLQVRRTPPRAAQLLVLPLLMALWANLHGAWLLGLAELGLWLAVEILLGGGDWRRRAGLAAVGVATVVATLATPYGIGLWAQLWRTMGPSLRDVTEWRGLWETGSPAIAVWLALVGLGVYAGRGGIRPSHAVVLAFLAFSAWRVRRTLPFFGLATVSLLAPQFAALSRRDAIPRLTGQGTLGPWLRTSLLAAAVALIVTSGWQTVRAFACIHVDHTAEADVVAASFLRRNDAHGRMLTYSDWGLYAIWHLTPALAVSMDGRREFAYPLAELARHGAIYENAPEAIADVEALAPDWVWLPAWLPVIPRLRAHGWQTAFATNRSVVLTREPNAAWTTPPARPLPGCFPADPEGE